jgi:hypothetical protein
LILPFDTGRTKAVQPTEKEPGKASKWSKTQYANLIRYAPSGIYFARIRVQGKLILEPLKTTRIPVAKLRLAGLGKEERQKAENQTAIAITVAWRGGAWWWSVVAWGRTTPLTSQ